MIGGAAPAAGGEHKEIPDYASMPGLGDEEYPGFPADVCPDAMPDLSEHASIMTDVLKLASTDEQDLSSARPGA